MKQLGLFTRKVYIDNSLTSPDKSIFQSMSSPDVSQFYDEIPKELWAKNEEEAAIVINLDWKYTEKTGSSAKGTTITTSTWYVPECDISIVESNDQLKDKYQWPEQKWIYGQSQSKYHAFLQPAPVWPVKEVLEYLHRFVPVKRCPNCKEEIFLESWTCPKCNHVVTNDEMLKAENEIRRGLLEKYYKNVKGSSRSWLALDILFFILTLAAAYLWHNMSSTPNINQNSPVGPVMFFIFALATIGFLIIPIRKYRAAQEIQKDLLDSRIMPLIDGPLSRKTQKAQMSGTSESQDQFVSQV
jgi:hypothetical protein